MSDNADYLVEPRLSINLLQASAERVTVISADGTGGAVSFDDTVASTVAGPDVDASIDRIDHDTVTRYMFTSGSTGMPKGVIHTQGMACQLIAATEGRVGVRAVGPEVRVLDWMPWSHVGAGVMRVNGIITNGGSIFLDTGRPVAGEHQRTIDNLREVRPTMYAGSPLGYSMLVDALEADDDLAAGFFADVTAMQGGSAAMPKSLSPLSTSRPTCHSQASACASSAARSARRN